MSPQADEVAAFHQTATSTDMVSQMAPLGASLAVTQGVALGYHISALQAGAWPFWQPLGTWATIQV
jgi:hypothetical protein